MGSATAHLLRKALIHMLEDDYDDRRPFVQGAEVRILAASVMMRDG